MFKWLINKLKRSDEKIDIAELEKKAEEIKRKCDNPHNKEYHEQLNEFLQTKLSGRDNFINWLTGLATGALFFTFNKLSNDLAYVEILVLGSKLLVLTVFSALVFKIFLEIRYVSMKLGVEILKNLWEGHNIRNQIEEIATTGNKKVDEKIKTKFLCNFRDSLRFYDEDYLEGLKRPIGVKTRLLTLFYWLTIGLFVSGIAFISTFFLFITKY
ncbi:MAG: hypothetical protein HYS08_01360 [Chlamydiae bacterium]|nr:hypothetical protein [Chlamydiota bacterium]MBI3265630.1 hypothetical protein [Chlamydiota bacterium]